MKLITIVNRTKGAVVATRISVADTFLTRLVGLLGRKGLDADCGLLIQPSSGVHTFGMRFPIDIVALDRQLRVRAIWHGLRPWRTSDVSWKTHAVLELPAGHIQHNALEAGDQLEVVEHSSL